MIILYGIPLSNNVNKVRYCLNYLGLDYELKELNPLTGENQTDEYEKICPTKKIPAVEINGKSYFESNAINKYFASKEKSWLSLTLDSASNLVSKALTSISLFIDFILHIP